jgi:hypothetical protein
MCSYVANCRPPKILAVSIPRRPAAGVVIVAPSAAEEERSDFYEYTPSSNLQFSMFTACDMFSRLLVARLAP